MGWRDCELFMEAIETSHSHGIDFTSQLSLQEYQKNVRIEHGTLMAGMYQLKNISASSFPPLVLGRNIGTALINSNSAVKDLLISRAS